MDNVSIILATRKCPGKDVEIIGGCDGEYRELDLYGFAVGVIELANKCGGRMIPWTKEPQYHKFCYAFRFETEEGKKEFLTKLFVPS